MKLNRLRGTYLVIEIRVGKQKSYRSLKRRYMLRKVTVAEYESRSLSPASISSALSARVGGCAVVSQPPLSFISACTRVYPAWWFASSSLSATLPLYLSLSLSLSLSFPSVLSPHLSI